MEAAESNNIINKPAALNLDYNQFVATIAQTNDEDVNYYLCKLWNINSDELSNKLEDIKVHGSTNNEIQLLSSSLVKINNSNNDIIVSESLEPNKVDYSKFGIVTSISDI